MDIQGNDTTLCRGLQRAAAGQGRIDGLAAQRPDVIVRLQYQILRIQRGAVIALDDAAVARFQRGGACLVVDRPIEIEVVADTDIHAAFVTADEANGNRVVCPDAGVECEVAAGRHPIVVQGFPATLAAFAGRVPLQAIGWGGETEIATTLHDATAVAHDSPGKRTE